MKLHLIIVWLLIFASLSFGQKPSASPTLVQPASPEKTRTNAFGSSLEKYKNKEQRNFQNKQKRDESDDDETIRVKTDLVVNDVLVTDQNGKMISDLKKDDFIVMENREPQKIEVFAHGEKAAIPRSIVLIIDNVALDFPYLNKSIQAAKLLIDQLNPNDKMAVVTADVKLLVDFTHDKTLLKNALDSLTVKTVKKKDGGGFEFETLLAVLNEMFSAENKQPIIIFQGNANEIVRIKTGDDTLWQFYTSVTKFKVERYLEFRDIEEAVEKSRATIYSVVTGLRILGVPKKEQLERARKSLEYISELTRERISRIMMRTESRRTTLSREFQEMEVKRLTAAQTAMFRVAELSGGFTSFLEKPEDAENVYSDIFKQISNRYVIGYYPMNQTQDRKRREVKIEVRNHPEYVVTGRKAYFPQ
ncbi:MAG TPA: VWA domain-containing protein [Pyrinomonadaceae bacterium]|jgi:VWFA-related protein